MTSAGPARRERVEPASRRAVVLGGLVVAGIAVVLALAAILGGPTRRVETGVVVAVQATSLSDVQGFSIRAADGRTVDFRIGALENGASFPPGHLAEHRVSLAPVRVTFVDRDGAHVAVRVEDGA